jgi:asparaginyl-tRNA synthetase
MSSSVPKIVSDDASVPIVKKYSSCVGGRTRVKDIIALSDEGESLIGQTVTVCGWVKTDRRQGSKGNGLITFVELTDGSMMQGVQVVLFEGCVGFEESSSGIGTGAAIKVVGEIVRSPAAKQVVEIAVKPENQHHSVSLLGGVDSNDYPLAKKQHSLEYLREIAHLRPRSNLIGAVARVRSSLARCVHEFFQSRGFLYVHTPIITAADCEGAGEMFQVTTAMSKAEKEGKDMKIDPQSGKFDYSDDFFSKPAFLTVSGQLSVENYACALSDVYTFGPTFRAENSHTTRHLSEFWMIEPEIAFANLADDMDCIEDFLKYSVQWALDNNMDDLKFFDERIEKGLIKRLEAVMAGPFARCSYTEAIEILERDMKAKKVKFENTKVHWGMDLDSEHERYITEKVFNKPTFVYNYPKDIKAFYMRLNEDGKTVAATDCLAPGIGEVVGGSQREERLDILDQRIKEMGLAVEDYGFYRDLRRYGSVPHSGFGVGFERLIMYITGVSNIRDVIPFPRYPGHAEF